MSKENKDLSGVLFKNDRKETERHPDYTGNMTVKGVDYWLSAWVNEAKNGKKYFALKLTEKQAKPEKAEYRPADIDNHDLPF